MKLKYRKKNPPKQGRILEGGGEIFFWLARIYIPLVGKESSIKGKILPQILDTGITNAAFKSLEARQGVRAYATPIKDKSYYKQANTKILNWQHQKRTLYQQFKHVSTKISAIFLYSPDLSNPVEIFDPVDAVDILEVGVDGVPVVLDHPFTNVALEGLGLGLALKS